MLRLPLQIRKIRRKKVNKLQLFAFDSNNYCDFSSSAAKAMAGKDILLCVFSSDGSELLAISGQHRNHVQRYCRRLEIEDRGHEGGVHRQ